MSIKKAISDLVPGFIMQRYVKFKKNMKWKGLKHEDVFNKIYEGNGWGGHESVSGRGSDDDQTAVIVTQLPAILKQFEIKSVLDIPCGDFMWMQRVDLNGIDYTGGDIVKALIEKNTSMYQKQDRNFKHLDLCESELPRVDAVFCRDCLVHLSFDLIFKALSNISKSGSKYLITTTFTDHLKNEDIVTGNWRTLNFEQAPFNFGKPVFMLNEKCTEGNGAYADKCIAVWEVAALPLLQASANQ